MPVVTLALLLAGALRCSLALAQTSCSNPSPLPSGYAAPCPVFSVSPASVSQTGTLSLSATPQAGTDYIYTTAYYAKGSTWLPITLQGNNAAPSYSSGPATGSLTPSILSILPIGTNYIVLWDWLWDSTAGCYKGPGLNQCNTGQWRVQVFNITSSSPTPTSTPTPSSSSTPTPTPNPNSGENLYVTPTGTGLKNGSSWNNAFAGFSGVSWGTGAGKVGAGDTLCIAGGTYSQSLTVGASGTSGNVVTIKRATVTDPTCGSGTAGWNSAYDAQVVMNGTIGISGTYVTIDGSVWNGIQVVMQNPTSSYRGITGSGVTDSITLRNIEVAGPCPNGVVCHQNAIHTGLVASSWNGSSYNTQSNWLLQYMNIHGGCQNIQVFGGRNWIIEHSRFADSDDTTGVPCHPNVFYNGDSSNITFRYNEVVNWGTEGIMFNGSIGNWYFYGNIWHDAATNSFPRIMAANGATNVGPVLAYNNTFINCGSRCYGAIHIEQGGSYAAASVAYNNIYWNTPMSTGITIDYDLSDGATGETYGQNNAANPFINLGAGTVAGYNLKAHTNPGLNVGSPYNFDYIGNTRITWDRGAYEFK